MVPGHCYAGSRVHNAAGALLAAELWHKQTTSVVPGLPAHVASSTTHAHPHVRLSWAVCGLLWPAAHGYLSQQHAKQQVHAHADVLHMLLHEAAMSSAVRHLDAMARSWTALLHCMVSCCSCSETLAHLRHRPGVGAIAPTSPWFGAFAPNQGDLGAIAPTPGRWRK